MKNFLKQLPMSLSELVLTLIIGIMAAGLVVSSLAPASRAADQQTNLALLNERAAVLSHVSDPVERDKMCIPLAAYGRALDRALDKNARIFISGVVGTKNTGNGGYYFFLRNYLFPRDVEISLGQPPVFTCEWAAGIDCDSPQVLQSNGFDLLVRLGSNGQVSLIPLTVKGVPRQ